MADIKVTIIDREGNSHELEGPTDMNMNIMRGVTSSHLRTIAWITIDEIGGDDAGANCISRAVNILKKHIQRFYPLDKTAFEPGPFCP